MKVINRARKGKLKKNAEVFYQRDQVAAREQQQLGPLRCSVIPMVTVVVFPLHGQHQLCSLPSSPYLFLMY